MGNTYYPNLEVEMVKARMMRKDLAKRLGMTPTTLSMKLNGKSNISLEEGVAIKREIKTDLKLEELFKTE